MIYWKRVFHCTRSLVSCYFRRNAFFFIYSPITFLTYQFTFLICYSFSSKDYLIGARFDGNGYIQYAMGNFSLLTDFQIKIRLRTFQTSTSIFVVQSNTSVSRGFCHPNRKSEKKNTTGLLLPISFRKYLDQKNAVPETVWSGFQEQLLRFSSLFVSCWNSFIPRTIIAKEIRSNIPSRYFGMYV